MSEIRRGFFRMASNYARLAATLVLGLVLVRLLLRGLGNDGFGLIALLGSTIGFSAMLQDVVRRSMIRELGAAYHGDDDDHFRSIYNAALVLSTGVGLLTLIGFGALLILLPLFQIPHSLLPAARWFVAVKAIEFFSFTVLAAPFNMYLVSERMVSFNAWTTAHRAAHVAAAAWLVFAVHTGSISHGIILYGALSAGLTVAVILAASVLIMLADRRLVPAPTRVTRQTLKAVLHGGGWNAAVVTAMNMHLPLGALIMNLAFGLFGNMIFGLSMRLTSYVRMIATGMTTGLDAVAARLSVSADHRAMHRLVYHGTRLHGLATFPTALLVFVLAEPILRLWIGTQVQNPTTTLPPTVTLIRVLILGTVVRSISDGWMMILYGAGHIRRYALLILLGGVMNPILALLLLGVLHDPVRFTAPAWAFSIVLTVVHMGVLPAVGARALGLNFGQMLRPLALPLLAALLCLPIPIVASRQLNLGSPWWLLATAVVFGAAYSALALIIVLDKGERRRILAAILRRLSRLRAPTGA